MVVQARQPAVRALPLGRVARQQGLADLVQHWFCHRVCSGYH
jgi:hypothetical protein